MKQEKMKLILVRHPETNNNSKGIIEDQMSGDFTSKGKTQMVSLMEKLKNKKIDLIYSSDSIRCKRLAIMLSKFKNIKVMFDPLLREINNGNWVGKKEDEVKVLNDLGIDSKNGESFLNFKQRVLSFLNKLQIDDKNLLIITHGCFIKIFIGSQKGLSINNSLKIKVENCSINEVEI